MMNPHEPREPDQSDVLVALSAIDEETTRRLHDRLVRDAQTAGLLDVAYRTIDSPVGPLLLAATAKGLVRVAYERENHEKVLEHLARDLSPRILHAPARLDAAAKEIDEYFAGLRRGFDVPLDFSLSRGFRRLVLARLRAIGYGQTASYAAIAVAAGNPKAVRAVGTACATNPIPVVVPCHRVVRSDGSIGQYVGGVDAKKTLLTLEAPGRQAD
jgi:methylated-DNA-[protein]-cysteine S-methyltransferase